MSPTKQAEAGKRLPSKQRTFYLPLCSLSFHFSAGFCLFVIHPLRVRSLCPCSIFSMCEVYEKNEKLGQPGDQSVSVKSSSRQLSLPLSSVPDYPKIECSVLFWSETGRNKLTDKEGLIPSVEQKSRNPCLALFKPPPCAPRPLTPSPLTPYVCLFSSCRISLFLGFSKALRDTERPEYWGYTHVHTFLPLSLGRKQSFFEPFCKLWVVDSVFKHSGESISKCSFDVLPEPSEPITRSPSRTQFIVPVVAQSEQRHTYKIIKLCASLFSLEQYDSAAAAKASSFHSVLAPSYELVNCTSGQQGSTMRGIGDFERLENVLATTSDKDRAPILRN